MQVTPASSTFGPLSDAALYRIKNPKLANVGQSSLVSAVTALQGQIFPEAHTS